MYCVSGFGSLEIWGSLDHQRAMIAFGIVNISTVGNRNDEALFVRIKDCIIVIGLPNE